MNAEEKCCDKPAITRMMKPPAVNTICLHCKTHWYGTEGNVKRFTGKEWDAWVSEPEVANEQSTV